MTKRELLKQQIDHLSDLEIEQITGFIESLRSSQLRHLTANEDPLIGLFAGSPNLATQSETILQQNIHSQSGWTWKS